MTFGTMFIRSILFAIGSLLGLAGIGMLLSVRETRTEDIHRREDLHTAWRMVEKQRAEHGALPLSVSVETTAGNGRFQSDIFVNQWRPVNWRHPRDFDGEPSADGSAKDYLLSYSNPSCDWMDILDSKTGQTSLDNTGIQNYLLQPVIVLALAYGLFYLARCLKQ